MFDHIEEGQPIPAEKFLLTCAKMLPFIGEQILPFNPAET